jgi:hypothetical protein
MRKDEKNLLKLLNVNQYLGEKLKILTFNRQEFYFEFHFIVIRIKNFGNFNCFG